MMKCKMRECNVSYRKEIFCKIQHNIMEILLSKDHLTNHEVKEHSLNLSSNHCSPSDASSKRSKPQYEANAGTSSNGKKDKQKKKGSSTSSNLGTKVGSWCHMHLLGTASSHIWTQYKSLKHGEIEMVLKLRLSSRK
jgi:hypothetical protein